MKTFTAHFSGRPAKGLRFGPAALALAALLAGCASKPVDERLVNKQDQPAASKPTSCVQQGASRLPPRGECASTPGRSYSKEDLDKAGGTTLEEKLRVLDPAISGPR